MEEEENFPECGGAVWSHLLSVPGTLGCMCVVRTGQSGQYCVGSCLIGTLLNEVPVSPTRL